MSKNDELLRLDLQWIVSKLDTPDKAARHTYRGTAAIKHVAKQALDRHLARESHGAVVAEPLHTNALLNVTLGADGKAAIVIFGWNFKQADGAVRPEEMLPAIVRWAQASVFPATAPPADAGGECEAIEAGGCAPPVYATPAAPPKEAQMEGWHSAINDAGELFSNAPDQRFASRASRVVTYLKTHPPIPTPPKDAGAVATIAEHEAAGCPLARELRVLRQMCSCGNDMASVDEAEARYLELVATHPQPEGCVVEVTEAMVEAARDCADTINSCSEDWSQEEWSRIIAAALAAASSGAGEGR